MNKLEQKRAQILAVLCEGMGINAATRIGVRMVRPMLKSFAGRG